MPRTGQFGGFEFDPQVFSDMMQEGNYFKNEILASGVIVEDSSIMDLIGEKGNVASIAFYAPLNVFDQDMEPLNNDGETNNVPVTVSGKKQTCMLIQRMKAFKAKDFTKELTGADPMGNVRTKIEEYYQQVWERELMNIAEAVLGVTDLSSHVTDLSITSGTISDKNKINEGTMIDACTEALGDMASRLGLVIMHSKIYARYQKMDMVDFKKYTVGGVLEDAIELPTINGKVVLVTDYYTVDNSKSGFPVYKTFIFGEGAFLTCEKKNYENQYASDFDPETSAGIEKLYTKQGRVIHPNGLSLAVDNIEKESPTFAELGNKANYSLKFNHKNVFMGLIKSNG